VVLTAAIVVVAAVVIVLAVAWPLLGRAEDAAETPDARAARRAALEEDLERALASIREIEQDHRAGALSDEDFVTLDRDERRRAVEIMRRIDAISPAPAAPPADEARGEEDGERSEGSGMAGTNS
jgi:hypothetical protein